jgi:hypothetical protein
MKNFKCVFIALLSLLSLQVFSQDVVLESGNLNFLKTETKIRLEYDYSNMGVGEYAKEEDYIKMKVAEADKSKSSSGAKWLNEWNADRKTDFQPAFQEMLNKKAAPLKFDSSYTNTNVTLILTTTYMEPGFYTSGFIQKKAEINVIYTFVDSNDHSKVLAKISAKKIISVNTTYAYDLAYRVKGAYSKAAMVLAEQIKKAK